MKKIIPIALAALGLLALPQGWAWTYSDGDVLLIFRDKSTDVEFDLGNVSQFLGHPNGYTVQVNNWSSSLVAATYGSIGTNTTSQKPVKVLLVASTTTNAWVTSIDPNTTAYQQSPAAFGGIYGVISEVGNYPLIYSEATNNTWAQSYVITVAADYANFDYLASGGTYNSTTISKLGGNIPFVDETGIPASGANLDFWSVAPNGSAIQTPDNLVGTFSLSAAGVLTFVAGPRPPAITGFTHAGSVTKLNFPTTIGNTYYVSYTNQLGGAVSTWPVDPNSVTGDGNTDTISHTNSGVTAEFFKVQAN